MRRVLPLGGVIKAGISRRLEGGADFLAGFIGESAGREIHLHDREVAGVKAFQEADAAAASSAVGAEDQMKGDLQAMAKREFARRSVGEQPGDVLA